MLFLWKLLIDAQLLRAGKYSRRWRRDSLISCECAQFNTRLVFVRWSDGGRFGNQQKQIFPPLDKLVGFLFANAIVNEA